MCTIDAESWIRDGLEKGYSAVNVFLDLMKKVAELEKRTALLEEWRRRHDVAISSETYRIKGGMHLGG